VPVVKSAAGITIGGFAAALGEQGPARGPQHVFVNNRIVRDRTISHAIQAAYAVATIKERSPEVHLFIELGHDRVDVNVHPTKAEVRFLEQGLVHEVLRRAIVDALGGTAAPELVLSPAIAPASVQQTSPLPLGFDRQSVGPQAQPAAPITAADFDAWTLAAAAGAPAAWPQSRSTTQAGQDTVSTLIRPMTPIGQFRNTFIIAVDDDGLAIIDQHVAHERILFEQFSERLTSRELESQRLLTPIVLEVSPGEHQTLLSNAAALSRFGFDLEDFGGTSLGLAQCRRCSTGSVVKKALRAVAADLDGLVAGLRRGSCAQADGRDNGVSRGCEGKRSAHARKDAVPARRASTDVSFIRVPARPPVVLRLTRREIERTSNDLEIRGRSGRRRHFTRRQQETRMEGSALLEPPSSWHPRKFSVPPCSV
jgi:DNA mismatch repair protein MutL